LKTDNSLRLYEQAARIIPGGVNTSIRLFSPHLVFTRARGSKVYDADGNEYVDYHSAYGAVILGHCHPSVNKRVIETLDQLDLIGAGTTELEFKAAEKIVKHVPSAEMVHFCNTGSEATYHAIRLARAVTGRKKIGKFQGGYHGWHDSVLMNVITPKERLGGRDLLSGGMSEDLVEQTLILDYNDIESVEKVVRDQGDDMAAIIIEPIAHNVGCILPKEGFLERLRELTEEKGIVLVFDEVITGFRHGLGGYQKICGVTPDLTALGKAIANGYPGAAICGKKELMMKFDTGGGNVFFAGTYNAHPAVMAACLATIEELESGRVYERLFAQGDQLRKGLTKVLEGLKIKGFVAGFGSTFVVYFTDPPVEKYADTLRNDSRMDLSFKQGMTEHGILLLPKPLRRGYMTASHTAEDIEQTVKNAETVLGELAKSNRP